MVNVHQVANSRREFPNWNLRGKIRKVDDQGNIVEGQYAYGGELVRVSPRYQKNGTNYRVRPERPASFFAQFCVEHGLLPTALTAEEAESDLGMEILQPLWDSYKSFLPKLESPYAACDVATEPSLKVGFSFCVMQILIEQIGSIRPSGTKPMLKVSVNGSAPGPVILDSLRKKIEEMRARNSGRQEATTFTKKKGS
jgi:hypothetical protein